jgi:hypothetical protein
MPALPITNTARFWLDYTDGIHPHSTMFRAPNDATLADIMTVVDSYFTALGPATCLLTVTGARYALEASTVSLPVDYTGSATYGAGAQTDVNTPIEVRFEGRSPGGRRVSWSSYGWDLGVPGGYRLFLDVFADVAAAWNVLRDACNVGTLVAIDNGKPQLLPYANIQYNSYWETQQRR